MTTSPLQTSPDSSNKLQITSTETKGAYTNTTKKKDIPLQFIKNDDLG